MSWSKNYSGKIKDVISQVLVDTDPCTNWGEDAAQQEAKTLHAELFERGKDAIYTELDAEDSNILATGYVLVSYSGWGSYGNGTSSTSYTVSVTRQPTPEVEETEYTDQTDIPRD